MQFHLRLIWTFKVSIVPSNQLLDTQQGQWRSSVKAETEWDEDNSEERGKSEFPWSKTVATKETGLGHQPREYDPKKPKRQLYHRNL